MTKIAYLRHWNIFVKRFSLGPQEGRTNNLAVSLKLLEISKAILKA